MPFAPVDLDVLAAATAASSDARTRQHAGDNSVTSDELRTYGAFISACKGAGMQAPMDNVLVLVDRAGGVNPHRPSPRAHLYPGK